jgi:hypothetical protein
LLRLASNYHPPDLSLPHSITGRKHCTSYNLAFTCPPWTNLINMVILAKHRIPILCLSFSLFPANAPGI